MQKPVPARPRILVVEDDQDMRDTMRLVLEDEGYRVETAATLDRALALLDANTFALIVSDLFAINSTNVLATVDPLVARAHPTPVGVVTGWRLPLDEVEQHGLGFCLPKPFELDDFVTSVAAALERPLTDQQRGVLPLVIQYFERLTARDWDGCANLCTEDVVYCLPGTGEFASEVAGRAAFRAFTEQTFEAFPGGHFEDVHVYGIPHGLAARFRSTWRMPDGSAAEQGGSVTFGFAEGHISRIGVHLNAERLAALMRERDTSASGS